MNQPQPNHFTLITAKNRYVAKAVAQAVFKKYQAPAVVVDSTAFKGYNVEIHDRFSDISQELIGYAKGVQDFLEMVVNFDDLP